MAGQLLTSNPIIEIKMESYIKAKLTSLNKINVLIFTGINKREHFDFVLYKDNEILEKLSIVKSSFSGRQGYMSVWGLKIKLPQSPTMVKRLHPSCLLRCNDILG